MTPSAPGPFDVDSPLLARVRAVAGRMRAEDPELRQGQALAVALREVDPGLAARVNATVADPSDSDARISIFANVVIAADPDARPGDPATGS